MKTRHSCLVAVILAMGTVYASGGPYTVNLDGTIVEIGPDYQSFMPLGDGPHGVSIVEYSQDGFLYGVDFSSDTLVRIDPATGVSETVGSLGVDIGGHSMVDLDEDQAGQLRMLAWDPHGIYTIDRDTGEAVLECQPDFLTEGLVSYDGILWTNSSWSTPPDAGCGLEYINYTGLFLPNLELGPDRWIHWKYATSIGWIATHSFGRIHAITGAAETLGHYTTNDGLNGLTFDPTEQPPDSAIPTLDRNGALLLILLLISAGFSMLVRRS